MPNRRNYLPTFCPSAWMRTDVGEQGEHDVGRKWKKDNKALEKWVRRGRVLHAFLWDIIDHVWCQKRTLRIGYKEPCDWRERGTNCCSSALWLSADSWIRRFERYRLASGLSGISSQLLVICHGRRGRWYPCAITAGWVRQKEIWLCCGSI